MGKIILSEFRHEKSGDKVWWADEYEIANDGVAYPVIGSFIFSFDRKKKYSLFGDYPHALTAEEKEIFDRENPYWVDFFKEVS